MLNQEKNEVYDNSQNLIGHTHSLSQPTISVVINDVERTCNYGIQSNLDILPLKLTYDNSLKPT